MPSISRISLKSKASRPKHGLAMVFDLEGFSKFFNQPDVNDYVTLFLNRVFEAVGVILHGGTEYWLDNPEPISGLSTQPSHVKFLGDGALYIWTPEREGHDFSPAFMLTLCNGLWNLKSRFSKVIEKCSDDIPVLDLPTRIRFGLARGSIYELSHSQSQQKEYIGFCINLASRLQRYCPELGFIASARLKLSAEKLDSGNYKKVLATNLRGFPNEIVIVDQSELERLDPDMRNSLFTELPG